MTQLGALTPGSQVYQSSGISSPAAKLPDKFVSARQADSPLSGHMSIPSDFNWTSNTPVVQRAPRMTGMRYLYHRGMRRMLIRRLGADGQPYPQNSAVQPNFHGGTRNAGFNDALFQAGYPGFNLGLSFKVPTLPQNQPGVNPSRPSAWTPVNIGVTAAVNRLARSAGQPRTR